MRNWLRSLLSNDSSENSTTTPAENEPGLTASDIGFAVGVGGGTVADAAQLQYALSCVVPPGKTPTEDQIGRAVGILGGNVSEAIVLEALKKRGQ